MRVFDGTGYRDATPDEIAAWEEATTQPAPPPSPQEQMLTMARAMAATATNIPDTVARPIPDLLVSWEELLKSGKEVEKGVCLMYNGQCYRVETNVTPIETQKPGDDGMLAVYRPIDREHTGTKSDPIPWVNGMDCYNGKYYSYEGKIYIAKMDMIPCVWIPGSSGTDTVWEEVA